MPTWTTPGTYSWVVPAGITELTGLDLAGGEGGDDWSGAANGGQGGRLEAATIGVDAGDTLTIVVGGQGSQGVTGDDGSGAEGTAANSSRDLRAAVATPSGATLRATAFGLAVTSSSNPGAFWSLGGLASSSDTVSSGLVTSTVTETRITGTVVNSSTGGFVQLQWAQASIGANDITVQAGSLVRARRIA